MKGKPYQQATGSRGKEPMMSPEVREALARQAARRPDTGPPKELYITPRLPKAGNKAKRRGRAGGGSR